MFISPTPANAGLASAVNKRIRADGSMIAAKSALWHLTGIGVLCLMAGCGIGAALFGYSYVNDSRTSAEKMASAFAAALDHANLGNVRINPESVVKLDPSATVRVDPSSTVRVVGDLPRPTERQLAAGVTPTGAKVITNYTIFKEVDFANGIVETGWKFTNNSQDVPDRQYCLYVVKNADGVTRLDIDIGHDGRFNPASQNNPANLDTAAAFEQCVWYR